MLQSGAGQALLTCCTGQCAVRISEIDIVTGIDGFAVFAHLEVQMIGTVEFEKRSLSCFADIISGGDHLSQLCKIVSGKIAVDRYG